jgi:alkanesulfonate monooxygenase SsuD/methylene tetrahydromethanopterin reductase-like flavin-dependent oxidoreductase (luciferase family)
MRLSVVLSGTHPVGVRPDAALGHCRAVVDAARGRLDGITMWHGWVADAWNPQPLTLAAYLSATAGPLSATVRGLPLGIVNPVEIAEQLATVDHAWEGRFRASVRVGPVASFGPLGVDAAHGSARFAEGLDLIRRMWMVQPMAGVGPRFRFDEVRPTLRPVRPEGPALALETDGDTDLLLARELGLGAHLGRLGDLGTAHRLVRSWRTLDSAGEVSLEVPAALATGETLTALARAGADQVDVRIPGTATDDILRTVADLARLRDAVGR